MDCEACGARNDDDAKFCTQCAEALPRPPRGDASRRGSHGQSPGGAPVARIGVILLAMVGLGLGLYRIANRPSVQIEVIDAPEIAMRPPDAPEPTSVREQAPAREPTESERTLAGTWVATVGPQAPRRASIEGTMVQMRALQTGQAEPATRCVWLELYQNLRGFQHECGVVNGEPSALEQTDPATGESAPLGVSLSWSFQDGRLQLHYDEPMIVGTVRFTETVLALPEGSPPFDVTQSFPGHDDVPAQTHRFEVFSGRYLE